MLPVPVSLGIACRRWRNEQSVPAITSGRRSSRPSSPPGRLDSGKRHPLHSRCAVVLCRYPIGFLTGLPLTPMPRPSPASPGLLRLRLARELPSPVLHAEGRRCHLVRASRGGQQSGSPPGSCSPQPCLRFFLPTNPSATLSASTPVPGSLGSASPGLHPLREGTRSASPVARRVLAPMRSLPPPPK